MMLKLKFKGREWEVEISEENGQVKIKVNGKDFVFEEKERKEKIVTPRTFLPKRDFSRKEIKAPIAGVISDILVGEGDLIKEGQKVIVLSAMKMENEIISDFEGRINKIMVKKDQSVKEADILVTLV